jgi:hypothetical protein
MAALLRHSAISRWRVQDFASVLGNPKRERGSQSSLAPFEVARFHTATRFHSKAWGNRFERQRDQGHPRSAPFPTDSHPAAARCFSKTQYINNPFAASAASSYELCSEYSSFWHFFGV